MGYERHLPRPHRRCPLCPSKAKNESSAIVSIVKKPLCPLWLNCDKGARAHINSHRVLPAGVADWGASSID